MKRYLLYSSSDCGTDVFELSEDETFEDVFRKYLDEFEQEYIDIVAFGICMASNGRMTADAVYLPEFEDCE